MKILVTGGTGLLGAKLMAILSREHEIAGTCLTKKDNDCIYLDVTDRNQVYTILSELRPDVVIHTAAISDPDLCESDKEKTWKVNVEGTRNVAASCEAVNAKLIYISTDYVFDGTKDDGYVEDDEARPLNYYGLTKLEGEMSIQRVLKNYLIIRVPIFYGFNDEEDRLTFVSEIINKLTNVEDVYVDDEQIRYPMWIDDIAYAINELIKRDARGIYHLSSPEGITKYQWALKIADVYRLTTWNIKRLKSSTDKAKRPHNSKLNMSRIEQLGIKVRTAGIEEGLTKTRKQMGCVFRLIYSVRPDKLVLNQNASIFRVEIGKRLAEQEPTVADIVVGIPESGIFPATGYAAHSGIPFHFGIIRNYFIQRTVFEPDQETRLKNIRAKLIAVPDLVRGKRIVLIDEAIISGSTLTVAIDKLKRAGAKEIHVRIPSPPMLSNCLNGVLNPEAKLIALEFANKSNIGDEMRKKLGCDSLRFLNPQNFLGLLRSNSAYCDECFRPRVYGA